jgi:hypothetical protein
MEGGRDIGQLVRIKHSQIYEEGQTIHRYSLSTSASTGQQSLEGEEFCLLIKEIGTHQREFGEGHLYI